MSVSEKFEAAGRVEKRRNAIPRGDPGSGERQPGILSRISPARERRRLLHKPHLKGLA